jgi:hypothetical protein
LFVLYPAAGVALGLADPLLGQVVRQIGLRLGVATAVSVNVLLPLVAVGLGVLLVRIALAWLGAVTMSLAFIAGLAVRYPPRGQAWSLADMLAAVPPVLVLAMFGYAVLGTAAVLITRATRSATTPEESA